MVLSSGGYPGKLQPNFQIHGKVLFISIFLLGHADIGKLCFFFFFWTKKNIQTTKRGEGCFLVLFCCCCCWFLLFRTSGLSPRADFGRRKRLVTSELVFYVGGIASIHLFRCIRIQLGGSVILSWCEVSRSHSILSVRLRTVNRGSLHITGIHAWVKDVVRVLPLRRPFDAIDFYLFFGKSVRPEVPRNFRTSVTTLGPYGFTFPGLTKKRHLKWPTERVDYWSNLR